MNFHPRCDQLTKRKTLARQPPTDGLCVSSPRSCMCANTKVWMCITEGCVVGYCFYSLCRIPCFPVCVRKVKIYWLYLAESTSSEAPHYAVFCSLILFHSSSVSSVCCSHSSLDVWGQFSDPYKTTGKIIGLYILSFIVFTAYEKTKDCGLRALHAA
jgi:hypothetical protein